MFSYYGSKSKIAKLPPAPGYDTIIEPFAGAAWYSVLHRNKNVMVNDAYSVVYGIWDWLINKSSKDVILSNSDFNLGDDISILPLDKPHVDFIGYCANRGSSTPKNIVQKWNCQVASRPEWASTLKHQLVRAAGWVDDIRHWKVSGLDYRDLPDIEATWFIDPPYQFGGEHYAVSGINYAELADWCMSRRGQVIVCENSKADWMDFKPLVEMRGVKFSTTECIWTNGQI